MGILRLSASHWRHPRVHAACRAPRLRPALPQHRGRHEHGPGAGAGPDGENLVNGVWAVVSKPGCIAANAKGERVGDGASVHVVEAMHAGSAVAEILIGVTRS